MARNAWRATGSIDQPTSCPCVHATARLSPSDGASNASGAAAPNHAASQDSARAISRARRRTSGVGNISDVGCRTTGKGC